MIVVYSEEYLCWHKSEVLVCSHLDYAAQVWDPLLKNDKKYLGGGCVKKKTNGTNAPWLNIFLTGFPSLRNTRLLEQCTHIQYFEGAAFLKTCYSEPLLQGMVFSMHIYCIHQPFARTNEFTSSFIEFGALVEKPIWYTKVSWFLLAGGAWLFQSWGGGALSTDLQNSPRCSIL